MQAIKAIYDGENFLPKQPIPVKGKYEVIITFIDEVKSVDEEDALANWAEIKQMILESTHEDYLLTDDVFCRNKITRNLINFEEGDFDH